MPTYTVKQLGIPASAAFAASIATSVIQLVGALFFGNLSDRIGRTWIVTGAGLFLLVFAYPVFLLLHNIPTFGVLVVSSASPSAHTLERYQRSLQRRIERHVGYNVFFTIFGEFAPFIVTSLIGATGNQLAPSFYLIAAAIISLVTLAQIRKLGLR